MKRTSVLILVVFIFLFSNSVSKGENTKVPKYFSGTGVTCYDDREPYVLFRYESDGYVYVRDVNSGRVIFKCLKPEIYNDVAGPDIKGHYLYLEDKNLALHKLDFIENKDQIIDLRTIECEPPIRYEDTQISDDPRIYRRVFKDLITGEKLWEVDVDYGDKMVLKHDWLCLYFRVKNNFEFRDPRTGEIKLTIKDFYEEPHGFSNSDNFLVFLTFKNHGNTLIYTIVDTKTPKILYEGEIKRSSYSWYPYFDENGIIFYHGPYNMPPNTFRSTFKCSSIRFTPDKGFEDEKIFTRPGDNLSGLELVLDFKDDFVLVRTTEPRKFMIMSASMDRVLFELPVYPEQASVRGNVIFYNAQTECGAIDPKTMKQIWHFDTGGQGFIEEYDGLGYVRSSVTHCENGITDWADVVKAYDLKYNTIEPYEYYIYPPGFLCPTKYGIVAAPYTNYHQLYQLTGIRLYRIGMKEPEYNILANTGGFATGFEHPDDPEYLIINWLSSGYQGEKWRFRLKISTGEIEKLEE